MEEGVGVWLSRIGICLRRKKKKRRRCRRGSRRRCEMAQNLRQKLKEVGSKLEKHPQTKVSLLKLLKVGVSSLRHLFFRILELFHLIILKLPSSLRLGRRNWSFCLTSVKFRLFSGLRGWISAFDVSCWSGLLSALGNVVTKWNAFCSFDCSLEDGTFCSIRTSTPSWC